MISDLIQQRPRADRAFFHAFNEQYSFTNMAAVVHFLKAAAFVALLIRSYINNQTMSDDLLKAIILNLIVSLFSLLVDLKKIKHIFTNLSLFLTIAEESRHAVHAELTKTGKQINDCVSEKIFAAETSITEAQMDKNKKKQEIQKTKQQLIAGLQIKLKWYKPLQKFQNLLSLASLLNSIIILIIDDIPTLQKITLSIYITMVGLSIITYIIVILLIGLIPLFCIGLCLYYCCMRCGKINQNGGNINLDEQIANSDHIINAGGDCSICYMSISQGDKIYVLPCSDKHVFHSRCLRHWTKVKNTCPYCRVLIPIGGPKHPIDDEIQQ